MLSARVVVTAALGVCSLACSGPSDGPVVLFDDPGRAGQLVPPPVTVTTPTVVTGFLSIAVEEGDVGFDGISEINYGWIELDDGDLLIEVAGDVIRESGLTREEFVAPGRFEMTIAGRSELYVDESSPTFRVSSVSPVD